VEKIKKQIKSEIKQLPMMIVKLIGGIMAVIGFAGAVVIITRRPQPSFTDIFLYALAGLSGIVMFYISSKVLEKQVDKADDSNPARKDKTRTSMISWTVLLILAAVFILITWMVTR